MSKALAYSDIGYEKHVWGDAFISVLDYQVKVSFDDIVLLLDRETLKTLLTDADKAEEAT